ncbi:hypothetical protein Bbelb_355030 [Branchiostoma belcheri]|nr:hypothetical protein Bbelb_355030 [Branchiostoma belcheri]
MRTSSEWSLSDHRAKVLRVRVTRKKWRANGRSESRVPRIKWEVLKDEEKKKEYEERTRALLYEKEWEENVCEWKKVSEVMLRAAKEVCGEVEGKVKNPWVIGHEEEIESLVDRVNEAVNQRNECRSLLEARKRLRTRVNDRRMDELEDRMDRARARVKNTRKEVKRYMRMIEKLWWEERIRECKEACETGKIGQMYKLLKQVGTKGRKAPNSWTIEVKDFKEHFERVSRERYEEAPSVLEGVIERVNDLRGTAKAYEANEMLNRVPEREEIEEAMKEMTDSAPGEDGVRLRYILDACEEVQERVIETVRFMFEKRANEWEASVKSGIMVPLFKKGDRKDVNNYRGVCLLSMCSRVLARVIAKRLSWWAEWLGLLDDNQAGFRKGRSTADVVQMMVRMQEDVADCKRRVNGEEEVDEIEWPVARLLDLRKAYPRVNKPALWALLERYGMSGKCLESVIDLHESTEYKVRGKEGMSEPWVPARGLREGCSTSPILFNIYHQAVMRQGEEERRKRGGEVGVPWRWVPGGSFAGNRVWEKGGTEVKSVKVPSALFADDTSILGMSDEIEAGVTTVKEVMTKWEERNNDDKEEILEFGTEEGGGVRVLGSWLDGDQDVKNRVKRANGLWWKVKGWLKGSKMSKREQARVVEACVESSLLYDCQARVWYKRDIDRLQKWIDKCYRYVWSNRNGEPLRQMEGRHENMQDVRSRLNVKSVRWKIEKRVLERVGHVMRMSNDRITKAVVLGWYQGLEGKDKVAGRKRKTVLYWKGLLKDSGVDWTDVERLSSDRDGWRKIVRERMDHLDKWERQRGNKYEWSMEEGALERNVRVEMDLVCRYEGCGKRCKSKGGSCFTKEECTVPPRRE